MKRLTLVDKLARMTCEFAKYQHDKYSSGQSVKDKHWYDAYNTLNLYGGHIDFILEDDEDMIEIRYSDGMLIDVGKIRKLNRYLITVVSSDDKSGWSSPLIEIAVDCKDDLPEALQSVIRRYRKTVGDDTLNAPS